jgi:hypothetical protein
MLKKILLIANLLMLPGIMPLMAQEYRYIGNDEYRGNFEPITREIDYSNIKGSPYLDKKLIRGFVKFNNGDSSVYFLRYDIFSGDMEYLDQDKLFTILKIQLTQLDYISLNNQILVYKDYYIKNKQHTGFLQEMLRNKCSLYQRYRVEFQPAKPAETTYHEPTPAQFKRKPAQWYYACGNERISLFTTDNIGLRQIGGPYYGQLKAYLKKNKLKMKRPADLVALFTYYNTLVED